MSKTVKLTLTAIALFIFAMVASFVWFVATWDRESELPVSRAPSLPERPAYQEWIL